MIGGVENGRGLDGRLGMSCVDGIVGMCFSGLRHVCLVPCCIPSTIH